MSATFPIRPFLRNSLGSSNMAVNGLITPVDFIYQPAVGTIMTAYGTVLNAAGTGTIAMPTEFWDFPALVNGIRLVIRMNGVVEDYGPIIKTNFNLIEYIGAEFLGKIIGTRNIVRGETTFAPALSLNGNRGDWIKLVIQDNLRVPIATPHLEVMTLSLKGSLITL